jgi:hypothetical protein
MLVLETGILDPGCAMDVPEPLAQSIKALSSMKERIA